MTFVSDQEIPPMILSLLRSFPPLLLLSSLVIANQTIESNTTTSPCSLIEEAFRNVTEAGDEVGTNPLLEEIFPKLPYAFSVGMSVSLDGICQ